MIIDQHPRKTQGIRGLQPTFRIATGAEGTKVLPVFCPSPAFIIDLERLRENRTVLNLFPNGDTRIAILDVSATGHMPDVLEMPYHPDGRLETVREFGDEDFAAKLG